MKIAISTPGSEDPARPELGLRIQYLAHFALSPPLAPPASPLPSGPLHGVSLEYQISDAVWSKCANRFTIDGLLAIGGIRSANQECRC